MPHLRPHPSSFVSFSKWYLSCRCDDCLVPSLVGSLKPIMRPIQKQKACSQNPLASSFLCFVTDILHAATGSTWRQRRMQSGNQPRLVAGYWICHGMSLRHYKALAGIFPTQHETIYPSSYVWLWERDDLSYWWCMTIPGRRCIANRQFALNFRIWTLITTMAS